MAAAQLPSWPALIGSAIDHLTLHRISKLDEIEAVRELLGRRDLLAAAERTRRLLGAPEGEYPAWLMAQFKRGHAQIKSTELIDRIVDLPCPVIATTNYDRLVSLLHPKNPTTLTWQEPIKMQTALRDHEPRIFHLHGVYDDARSVVFGIADYEALVADTAYRDVLSTLWLSKTLLFIGCSFDGLADPDFSRLLTWASTTFKGSPYRHYALQLSHSFTTEDVRRFLYNWRIQIVPYGPTHDTLAATLHAINPQQERAITIRAARAAEILRSPGPRDSGTFARLLAGISGSGPSVAVEFQAEARKLFERQSKGIDRMRGDLISLQRLMAGIIDPAMVRAHLKREWNRRGQPPEYKDVVIRSHAALSLVRWDLLHALKRRRVNIHGRVLDGYCSQVVHHLNSGSAEGLLDPYEFENMQRVLSTLLEIFDADPNAVFPKLRAGKLLARLEGRLLLLGGANRLELRSVQSSHSLLAELPIQTDLNREVKIAAFQGATALICSHRESVFAWDPRRSPTALASYSVSDAYGINSVAIKDGSSPLRLVIATIEGSIIWLEDFDQIRSHRPNPGSFFSEVVMLEERVFAKTVTDSGIYEILPTGAAELRFSQDDLIDFVLALPGCAERLSKKVEFIVAALHLDPHEARSTALSSLVQRFDLSLQKVYDRDIVALQARLAFRKSDSIVLFLSPSGKKMHPVGYCHIPERILQVFQITHDADGTPRLVGTVAPIGGPFDLIVRYRGVETPKGILFAPDGSLFRHEIDVVRIAMFDEDRGFVCDDRGVPFEVSFAAGTASRLNLSLEARPRVFDLVAL